MLSILMAMLFSVGLQSNPVQPVNKAVYLEYK